MKVLIDGKINKNQKCKLWEIIGDITEFSIEREYMGRLGREEICKVQNELEEYYKKEDLKRREEYDRTGSDYKKELRKLLGIKTKEEAEEYFDELAAEEQEVLEDIDFVIGKSNIPKDIQDSKEFLYQKITRIGTASVGGLYGIYFFKTGRLYQELMSRMNNIFDDYVIGKEKYENMVLYRNEQAILEIFTEQEEIILDISESQYEELQKLKMDIKKI